MKPFLSLVTALWVCGNVHAQLPTHSTQISETDQEWVRIENLPNSEKPKGTLGYWFHIHEQTGDISLYRETDAHALVYLKSLGDACIYNTAKGRQAEYTDGHVYLRSEMPFRATISHCRFSFNGGKAEYLEMELTDESARLLELGDSLLQTGDIAGAVDAYENMTYPMGYMNETNKALEVLQKAHGLSAVAYQKRHYAEAEAILRPAFTFYAAWEFNEGGFESAEALNTYETQSGIPMRDYLKSYATDYALYLYKAGKLAKAVSFNSYLARVLPDFPNPCLQWGDALYDLGKTAEAQAAYRQYQERMQQAGQSDKIPGRVLRRL